jgi:hypothetical protein
MAITPDSTGKLKAFLSTLQVGQARQLADAVERDRLRGGSELPHELILDGLRPSLCLADATRPGVPTPMRLFCTPFEDLLVEDASGYTTEGFISRRSLSVIWRWLGGEIMPDTLNELSARLVDHTLSVDDNAQYAVSSVLHAAAAAALRNALENARTDPTIRSQHIAVLGNEAVFREAEAIADALEMAPLALRLRQNLHRSSIHLDDEQLAMLGKLAAPLVTHQPHLLWTYLLLVRARLAHWHEALRLAILLDYDLVEQGDREFLALRFARHCVSDLEAREAHLVKNLPIGDEPLIFRNHIADLIACCDRLTQEFRLAGVEADFADDLANLRLRSAERLCDLCDMAPSEIGKIFPLKGYGQYAHTSAGVYFDYLPAEEEVKRAAAYAQFLNPQTQLFHKLGIESVHAGARHLALHHVRQAHQSLHAEIAGENLAQDSPAIIFHMLSERFITMMESSSAPKGNRSVALAG